MRRDKTVKYRKVKKMLSKECWNINAQRSKGGKLKVTSGEALSINYGIKAHLALKLPRIKKAVKVLGPTKTIQYP